MSVDSTDFSPDPLDPDDGLPDAGAAPGDRADRTDRTDRGDHGDVVSAGDPVEEQARHAGEGSQVEEGAETTRG